MSSESAPLDILRDSYWPCLRDLLMCGEATPYPETPYVITLGNMPELRSLELVLTLRPGVTAPILWPSDYDAACPWPHLQSFTTCHANLEDEIYRHLPPTLRRLLLYSYPYYGNIIWETSSGVRERQLQGALLTASQMLELLSRCQTPDLTELAVEFFADDHEFALWRFLPRAFPRLTSLTIHVYRAENAPADTLVPHIARDLARLTHLTTLRIHPGFAPIFEPPMPFGGIYLGGPSPRTPSAAEERLKAARDRAARTFADTLSSSLHTIFLLHPRLPGAHWIQYRIVPGKQPQNKSRAGRCYELRYARGLILATVEGSDRIISS
ncbi:uncharacterized protein TRAVEDRAFT_49012 [Trametes versicolor FP-101664 SS1]|uniref:uncharacterized protein n=1 Tax=Trametes versicolor (strain FP-101664) TaxID=717944 RepID=UPI0004622401|nr:uncharacterized protein TRAVEDRAFT_49012 [Trametes versicolor FP-101664 SS1]EIW57993.1 hypothetical protein TRAVEDRAFT_49012 [Trametes versicolor FP-101664 SS1]